MIGAGCSRRRGKGWPSVAWLGKKSALKPLIPGPFHPSTGSGRTGGHTAFTLRVMGVYTGVTLRVIGVNSGVTPAKAGVQSSACDA